ncbi:MAG: hypothetical protein Q7J34_09190 [Bacteroidales bacterium]|nr:hypothetical protein [Bacteroidales bacterium]
MQTGTLKTHSYDKTNRPVIDSLSSFNLSELFEKGILKQTLMKGELFSKILVNSSDRQVVLTTIHKDTEIDSFQSSDSVTFYVIEGQLKLHTKKESFILEEGHFFALHEHIDYRLTAALETIFLLTIAKSD